MMGAQPEPRAHLLAAPGTPTWELLGDQLSEPAAYPVEARRERKWLSPNLLKSETFLKGRKAGPSPAGGAWRGG